MANDECDPMKGVSRNSSTGAVVVVDDAIDAEKCKMWREWGVDPEVQTGRRNR